MPRPEWSLGRKKHAVSLGISTATVLNFEPARDPPPDSLFVSQEGGGEKGTFTGEKEGDEKKVFFLVLPLFSSLSWCGGRKGMADRWWLGCERGRGGRAPRKEKEEEEEGSFRGWREGGGDLFPFFFF